MIRRLIAAGVPSILFLALTLTVRPIELGYLGLLFFGAALLVAIAGAFLVRPDSEEPSSPDRWPWLAVLFVLAGAATALYWYRVWSYDAWSLGGAPMALLYGLTFWWPGLLLGALAWAAAGTEVQRNYRRYFVTLAVGLAAGVAGAGLYQASWMAYLKAHDRVPLDVAVSRVASLIPGQLEWDNRSGTLSFLLSCDWATEAPPYTVFVCLRNLSEGARDLLARTDVKEVNVQARAGRQLLFRGDASDEAPDATADWLKRFLPTALKDGGRLDKGSLDEMVWSRLNDFASEENALAFEKAFTYALAGNQVNVRFTADGPPSVKNIDLYAAAYSTANRIINETAAFFPEIERFDVDLAGWRRIVTRQEAAAPPFYLQSKLLPEGSVLGLVAKERGVGSGTLSPAAFRAPEPLAGHQFAVATVAGKTEEHRVGRLFEEITLLAGRLYVTEVKEDGTATVFVLPDQGVPAGPVSVAPVAEDIAANQWVSNLGFMPRADFATPAAPAVAGAS